MQHHIVLPAALNVRAFPRTTKDSTILGVLPLGAVIQELDADENRTWLRVRVGSLEGWASNRYLLDDRVHQGFPWMLHAAKEIGVAELAGAPVNRRIEAYFSSVGAKGKNDDTTAWCSAFVTWCVLQARAQTPSIPNTTGIGLGARAWHTQSWGADVTALAPLGCIAVLWRRRGSTEPGATGADKSGTPDQVMKSGTGGHVGFLAEPFKPGDHKVVLLGGNQNNQVCKQTYNFGAQFGLLSLRGVV
jgi:hypothetical protein